MAKKSFDPFKMFGFYIGLILGIIIGQMVGGTLMVLRAGQHPMREIDQAVKRLKQAQVNLRGMLFNDVNVQSQRYGAGKYSYQYTYKNS